ncbi:MAG: PEGA domain-containing protein, partial [Victivallaceae bacterium]|nr:PEGA domain-containing protein [Victivallaceae bacterium]
MKTYLAMIISLSILLMTACAPEKVKKPKGELELNSLPRGADVILNSTIPLKNQTPVKVRPAPGVYLVKMSKENHLPVWRYVKIRDGKKTSLTLKLPPVRGSVLITSKPSGGKVIMSGKNQGLTPLVLTDLKPGEYSAQVEHINRAPRVIKWAITDIRPKKVSASLDSDIGKLLLKTEPSRARVYIDDKARGISPF